MITHKIEPQGFEKLLKGLEEMPEVARPIFEQAMENSLAVVHDILAEYPPETEANQPGRFSLKTRKPMGFYERGRGWWYPVMRPESLGTFLGKRQGAIKTPKRLTQFSRVAGYKLRQTSERLGTKWARRIEYQPVEVTGEVGTTVSYADAVQGDQQAHIHAGRGWVTAEQALEQAEEEIYGFFDEAVDEYLSKFAK